MKKILITILATVLVCACVVGGSYAWLIATTSTVTNVFTVGDIKIELSEKTDLDLKMMPGKTITKDPTVTVKANSENCWLFVKIEEGKDVDKYLEYGVVDGWTLLEEGVYYREVTMNTADQHYKVLVEDQVTVKDTVTKADLEAVSAEADRISLSFTAYAVQKEGIADAATAWAKVTQ